MLRYTRYTRIIEPTPFMDNTYTSPPQTPQQNQQTVSKETNPHHVKNIYPTMRHFILTILILLGIFVILFLIHQNGKSIYENGI